MLIKLIGVMVILCGTTLLGAEYANATQAKVDNYKAISDFFGGISEAVKLGKSDISRIISDCATGLEEDMKYAMIDYANALMNSDTDSLTNAFNKCFTDVTGIEYETLKEFAKAWDAYGATGGIKCAEEIKIKTYERYTELMKNNINDKKIFVYSGFFAGLFIALIMI